MPNKIGQNQFNSPGRTNSAPLRESLSYLFSDYSSNFSHSFPSAFFSILDTYSPVKLGLKINQLLIKTSFPSKANPYFLIRSPATPRFSKSAWYHCSSICFSAASAVSSRDFSSPESLTLNSIMTTLSIPFFGSIITSYLPKPLSRLDVMM